MTMPPDVVRTRASSTVFVNASNRVNRDFAGMVMAVRAQVRCQDCGERKKYTGKKGQMNGISHTVNECEESGFV